jgi:hypothetical protein
MATWPRKMQLQVWSLFILVLRSILIEWNSAIFKHLLMATKKSIWRRLPVMFLNSLWLLWALFSCTTMEDHVETHIKSCKGRQARMERQWHLLCAWWWREAEELPAGNIACSCFPIQFVHTYIFICNNNLSSQSYCNPKHANFLNGPIIIYAQMRAIFTPRFVHRQQLYETRLLIKALKFIVDIKDERA